jgi:hypothetical protein
VFCYFNIRTTQLERSIDEIYIMPSLNLQSFSQLCTIDITSSSWRLGALSWLERLLRSIPLVNNLETVNFKLHLGDINCHDMTWRSIDSMITRQRFTRLRTITLDLQHRRWDNFPDFSRFLSEQVPNMVGEGVLSVVIHRFLPEEYCYVDEKII